MGFELGKIAMYYSNNYIFASVENYLLAAFSNSDRTILHFSICLSGCHRNQVRTPSLRFGGIGSLLCLLFQAVLSPFPWKLRCTHSDGKHSSLCVVKK